MASLEKVESFLAEPRNLILAGIRKDGRPHLSPNWFHWDGERFYVSTTRTRVKYAIFGRDPRAQIAIDDATAFRTVLVAGTVEIREDIAAELPRFRAIREKHGLALPSDDEHLHQLTEEGRVLLAILPEGTPRELDVLGPRLTRASPRGARRAARYVAPNRSELGCAHFPASGSYGGDMTDLRRPRVPGR